MKNIRLGDYVEIDSGYAFKSSLFNENEGLPIIRIRDVTSGSTSTYYSGKYDDKYLVYDGDLLISMDGSFVVRKWSGGNALLNQRVCRIKSKSQDLLLSDYIYRIIPRFLKLIEDKTAFVTVKHLSVTEINEIIIPLPNIYTQQKIVKILDKAQELIDKRKEQIEACDELIKSLFYHMFGELSQYNSLTLNACTKFIDYRGKTPELSLDGKIRMINAKSVGKGFFKYVEEFITEDTYTDWMKRGYPNEGDVLFVTEGHTFGNVCRIPSDIGKFAMGQRVITIQGYIDKINNVFLSEYMQTREFKSEIEKYKTGSSAQGIRSKELIKILIPIPPIELQNEFAQKVEKIEQQKHLLEQSLTELENNFNSLMQRAFKGELF